MTTDTDMEKHTSGQQVAYHNPLDDLPKDDIPLAGLCKAKRNYQRHSAHRAETGYDGVGSRRHEVQAGDSSQPKVFRKLHNVFSESAKQHQLLVQKILPVLATAPTPNSEFWWVYDIDHFTLYYKSQFTGFMITPTPQVGDFMVSIHPRDTYARTLISVPTLRQAQAICHTITWIFRDSLPVR